MSSHYYHYFKCSICQSSNYYVCQQVEDQIEYLHYKQFQHFIQIQYLLDQYDLLQTINPTSSTLQTIQENLILERQFQQFYNQEQNHIKNLLSDHKQHNSWHRYD